MSGCNKLTESGRRFFLGRSALAVAGAAAASTVPQASARATPALARVAYPVSRLGNLRDLKVNEPMDISYPDADSTGVLIKLGTPVEGGVGPDGDVVAFSNLCPHKGYPMFYAADDRTLNCPGHYSRFDCEKGGLQVWGHATQNLAQFRLRVDAGGDIHAEGVDELLYGRHSNVLA
ncbi:arsenate reductase (azurin) small subunit [Roseomonas aerophila]|uniref:Arsenate reductase (Azurin) small subunit n=1 Tax=Teichococcus aerophilus TaxID=1224513 RepID=A0ABR7RL32_9PROT|nr:arsenate reductase (azurin) small subunit [Pseudoroseomonas aerophila]MBC9207113.1 arsenate reductase (azurin) small subunit [Pseudoroseomonas aerophila]